MSEALEVKIPYAPRWFQKEIHASMTRFSVLVLHRRAGKTVLAINEMIKRIISSPLPNARGYYVAPFFSQAKRVAWSYVREYTVDIPGMRFNASELRAIFPNGAEIQLLGGDNYDSLRGIYADYVVLDEVAQMHPAIWGEIFRPALSDRKGSALFIGTPKGKNQFWDKWEQAGSLPGWYRAMYKVTETGALDLEEIHAAQREMSDAEFNQEYLCDFTAAIRGAFYAKEMRALEDAGRIMAVPYDETLKVITSWDLGIDDATVVIFYQIAGQEIRAINCLSWQGAGLPQIIKEIDQLPYSYSQHIAPHDIRVRELGTGKSRFDIAQSLGVYFDIAPGSLSIADGIQAVRSLIPKMVIDEQNCSVLIEALRQYRTEFNEKTQVFKSTPLHDWTSDFTDSLRYFAITDHTSLYSLWSKPQNLDLLEKVI